jgi:hypothetical protein
MIVPALIACSANNPIPAPGMDDFATLTIGIFSLKIDRIADEDELVDPTSSIVLYHLD